MAEVNSWNDMGLSEAEQDGVIRDMLAKARIRDPDFAPSSWRYFTAGMTSFVRTKTVLGDQSTPTPITREQRVARRRAILGC